MKIRLAKKILQSRFYYWKMREKYPDYYDEKRKCMVSPSWAKDPLIVKARTRYYKWLGVYKKKRLASDTQ